MHQEVSKDSVNDITALIPAAGYASRISPLPCSKEIYPIGHYDQDTDGKSGAKVISSVLLENMISAGAGSVYIIIRKGKWDIPEFYGNGEIYNANLAYLVTDPTKGAPFTINSAYPFIKNKKVLFGFPDIFFETVDPFKVLLDKQQETGSDIVLGLYEAVNPRKMDMVKIDHEGNVKEIIIKPQKTDLKYTWIIAVWTPVFTQYLNDTVQDINNKDYFLKTSAGFPEKEIFIGDIIQCSIRDKINVNSVLFHGDKYYDIGTVDGIEKLE